MKYKLARTNSNYEVIFFIDIYIKSESTPPARAEYVATTSLILCSIVLAVGLLGNILVIAVILTNKVYIIRYAPCKNYSWSLEVHSQCNI